MFDNLALLAALSGSVFTPARLFASGEQGVWYDPSDFSSMSQDDAGATPVTAVGQAVGRILDKSGRGNHATQTTPTARPILQQDSSGRYFLLFDGTDDFLVTGTITPGVDKVQVFAGVRKLSDAAAGVVCEFSVSSAGNNGSFALFAPGTAAANYFWRSRGTLNGDNLPTTYAAPITNVIAGIGDISGPQSTIRINGVQAATVTTSQGTGNYGSYAMYIGRRGGTASPLNGRLYGLIVRFASVNLDTSAVTNAETWMNGKTGAY